MAGSIAEIAFNTIRKEFDNFNAEDPNVYLIEANNGVLPMFSDKLSQKAEKYLEDFGVTVLKNEKVENTHQSLSLVQCITMKSMINKVTY